MSFEKAAKIDMEPCRRIGGCPHSSLVPKSGGIAFCHKCMEDMTISQDKVVRDWEND